MPTICPYKDVSLLFYVLIVGGSPNTVFVPVDSTWMTKWKHSRELFQEYQMMRSTATWVDFYGVWGLTFMALPNNRSNTYSKKVLDIPEWLDETPHVVLQSKATSSVPPRHRSITGWPVKLSRSDWDLI